MRIAITILCWLIVVFVLQDVFNTLILARRTRSGFRITRIVYESSWRPYGAIGRRIRSGSWRESFLGIYGPASLLVVFFLWGAVLIVAFAGLQWAAGFRHSGTTQSFADDLFLSATTFLSLLSGDPQNPLSRWIVAIEGGVGFSLLGLVIGYLPVFYQAFSKREQQISMLDARGGSPPSVLQMMKMQVSSASRLERFLEDWEEWAAEVLENQLSFPMMAWFRSHHVNQSWLTSLTAIVDCSAVISICAEGDLRTQADFTFAMGRHALVDIASMLKISPIDGVERLSDDDLGALELFLRDSALPLDAERLKRQSLIEKRGMYEPYAHALSRYLMMTLPAWCPGEHITQNWRGQGPGRRKVSFAVSDPFSKGSDL